MHAKRQLFHIKTLVIAVCLLPVASDTSLASEGLAGFGRVSSGQQEPTPQPDYKTSSRTTMLSIADLAPGLLAYFNNGPVFGLPGTVAGDFWRNTQLTGDWGGVRTDLARHGLFVDIYSTSSYQNVFSGGLKTGDAFVENVQYSINLDTGRAGLWPGGLFHFTAQSRYGATVADSFTLGAFVPHNTTFVHPGPLLSSDTYPTEYYLAQAFSKHFSIVLGKISDVFIPDETLFGDSYKYYFANLTLTKIR